MRSARVKVEGALAALPADQAGAVVLAADTVVHLAGAILGKPRNREHAVEMLLKLSGREHEVITACALRGPGLREDFAVRSGVVFTSFDRDTARAYAATNEPSDKAGAYAVQGVGARLVRGIHGSWTNVVGLPLAEVVEVLVAHRVIALTDSGLRTAVEGLPEGIEGKKISFRGKDFEGN